MFLSIVCVCIDSDPSWSWVAEPRRPSQSQWVLVLLYWPYSNKQTCFCCCGPAHSSRWVEMKSKYINTKRRVGGGGNRSTGWCRWFSSSSVSSKGRGAMRGSLSAASWKASLTVGNWAYISFGGASRRSEELKNVRRPDLFWAGETEEAIVKKFSSIWRKAKCF